MPFGFIPIINHVKSHNHHNRSSLKDRSGGFFFLDLTKSWLHSDLFIAILLISPASRDFLPDVDELGMPDAR